MRVKHLKTIFPTILLIACTAASAVKAQIASNPPFTLTQTLVANGGGEQSNAAAGFTINGSTGQPTAGTRPNNSPFAVSGGFWAANPQSPTAAAVSVSGRILTPEGRGLRNTQVILTDMQGNTRTAISSAFGYYRFPEIEAGQTYIFTVVSKRYQFTPQVLTVTEEIESLDFVAQAWREK